MAIIKNSIDLYSYRKGSEPINVIPFDSDFNNQTIEENEDINIFMSDNLSSIDSITFNHNVTVEFIEAVRVIKFSNCIFKKNFSIDDRFLAKLKGKKIEYISFENCTFLNDVNFDIRGEEKFLDILSFNACKFNGLTNFRGLHLRQLNFLGNIQNINFLTEFKGLTYFVKLNINLVSFTGVLFKGYLNFQECSKSTNFSFHQSIINSELNFKTKFGKLEFIKLNKIILNSKSYKDENKSKIQIKIIDGLNKSKILLSNVKDIDELVIGGNRNEVIGEIKFDKVYMSSLGKGLALFYNFIAKKFAYMHSTKIAEKIVFTDIIFENLSLKEIYLGESIFNGVEIHKLTLENATLNDCIFNGVTFNNYILGDRIDGIISQEKIKDNYRQLKYVMDKNNNYLEANKFYALELATYEKILRKKNLFKEGWLTKLYNEEFDGPYAKEISTYIVLKFSRFVSDFGNNWVGTVFLITLIALLATSVNYLFEKGFVDIGQSVNQTILTKKSYSEMLKGFSILMWISAIVLFSIEIIRRLGQKSVIIIVLSLILLGGCLEIFGNYKALSIFLDFLNPLYGFNFSPSEVKNMSFLEKFGLSLYKIIYGVFAYYLIVALKRATKR